MLVLRIFGALPVIALGASLAGYFATEDRRRLRFTARALVIGFVTALIFMALYALERLAVMVRQGPLLTAEALERGFERRRIERRRQFGYRLAGRRA